MKLTNKGWRQEPMRHSLAAKGIKTGRLAKPFSPGIPMHLTKEDVKRNIDVVGKEKDELWHIRAKQYSKDNKALIAALEEKGMGKEVDIMIEEASTANEQILRDHIKTIKDPDLRKFGDIQLREYYGKAL